MSYSVTFHKISLSLTCHKSFVSVSQFIKCMFQELWRQFLEEKEGPSEAAAAAPVKVCLHSEGLVKVCTLKEKAVSQATISKTN